MFLEKVCTLFGGDYFTYENMGWPLIYLQIFSVIVLRIVRFAKGGSNILTLHALRENGHLSKRGMQ